MSKQKLRERIADSTRCDSCRKPARVEFVGGVHYCYDCAAKMIEIKRKMGFIEEDKKTMCKCNKWVQENWIEQKQ